ncbi:MAG: penicillin-binding transpeptidase domain-containing protein [Actinomycetota bacterium]|nr:penicillin-binding transpeptidase domain-containing protein [Actinomycetota bacterium]
MDAGQTTYEAPRPSRPPPEAPNRRYRLTHRFGPIAAVAGVAFLAGVVVGALYDAPERKVAARFAKAWQRGDYAAMYSELSPAARARTPLANFRAAYVDTAATATALGLRTGGVKDPDNGTVAVPVTVRTRIFGTLRGTLRLPFAGSGDSARIDWRPNLTFPGVDAGQQLQRNTRLPTRGTLLTRDHKVLAKGDDRASDLSGIAPEILGELGPLPADRRDELRALGYPDDARVGISGLERALEPQLGGRPGGTLSIAGRVIGRSTARPARPVVTTIDPKIEAAAITGLAGQSGGVAVLRPATGEVLALAGTAYSSTGPPGSTFKLITTTAALEDHKVRLSDKFPVETAAVLSGVRLSNANGESCGGTFVEAFAQSCNSVFAPLGVKVGKQRLVQVAERYGFNEPPSIPGAQVSQIPQPSGIGDDLDLGSTAIGQGQVLASPLQLASVAATIGNLGLRVKPHVMVAERLQRVRVTSPRIAVTLRKLMIGVVKFGTGTAADISGVQVAGKTGTAELGLPNGQTDAWFTSFAPARHPVVAVCVWRLRAGAGGQAAAPIAHDVLKAGLKR